MIAKVFCVLTIVATAAHATAIFGSGIIAPGLLSSGMLSPSILRSGMLSPGLLNTAMVAPETSAKESQQLSGSQESVSPSTLTTSSSTTPEDTTTDKRVIGTTSILSRSPILLNDGSLMSSGLMASPIALGNGMYSIGLANGIVSPIGIRSAGILTASGIMKSARK